MILRQFQWLSTMDLRISQDLDSGRGIITELGHR